MIKMKINELLITESGKLTLGGKVLEIILIVVISFILNKFIKTIILKKTINKIKENESSNMRLVTIVNLLTSIIRCIVILIAIIMILDALGINTTSIMATVGVGSLAISFGAQSLIKDIINGFFIILEDQYRVGDHVIIEDYEGNIVSLGLRCTKIRDFSGNIHIIPNGKISIVTNSQRDKMRAKVVISVSLDESPNTLKKLLYDNLKYLKDENKIIGDINIWGVTNNTDKGYEISIVAFTKPGNQYSVEYEIREKVVDLFRQKNIKLPTINISNI